jgi:hypothetical protein
MAEERVELTVRLDPATARWLQTCVQRGGTMAAAAAEQLRALALATAGDQLDAFLADRPDYLDDMHEEQQAALAEAGIG